MVNRGSGSGAGGGEIVTEGFEDVYGSKEGVFSSIDRRGFVKGTAVAVTLGAAATGMGNAFSDDGSGGPAARGSDGVVSTPHPLATEAGARILERGGDAVDAAAAIQFALGVVAPHSTGLGGGAFAVVSRADDETHVVDGQVRAPGDATPDRFSDAGEGVADSGLAVGAPGVPKTIDTVLERWGRFGVDDVIEPAIELAEDGFEVTEELEGAVASNEDRFSPETRDAFSLGKSISAGETFVRKPLAETLRTLASDGIDAFHRGPIAEDVAATVRDEGGDLTAADLANYEVTVDYPLTSRYNGCPIATARPPSMGATLLQLLRLVDPLDLGDSGVRSAETYDRFLQSSRLAYADGLAHLGDAAAANVPLEGMLSDEYTDERRDALEFGAPGTSVVPGDPRRFQSTGGSASVRPTDLPPADGGAHFSVVDADGNAVSWTSSLSSPFGAGIAVPERGIVLANSLANFDFAPGGPNQVAPNKRPLSPMSPTILFEDGAPLLTLGSGGGASIPSAVAQVVVNAIEHRQGIAAAVDEPRAFSSEPHLVRWEEALPEDTRAGLREMGYELPDWTTEIGAVQALRHGNGVSIGVADSRRNGAATDVSVNETSRSDD